MILVQKEGYDVRAHAQFLPAKFLSEIYDHVTLTLQMCTFGPVKVM